MTQADVNKITELVIEKIKREYYLTPKSSPNIIINYDLEIQKIINFVCELKDIKYENLKTENKTRNLTECRYIIYFLIRKLYPMISYKKIGAYFNRGHAAVLSQIRVLNGILSVDKIYNAQLQQILFKFELEKGT